MRTPEACRNEKRTCLRRPARGAGAQSPPRASLESADAAETVGDFVTLAGVVVPVELAGLFALGELVRAVAIRLVLGEAAFTQPNLFAVHYVAGGFLRGAFDES